jgi:histidine triad (HIT) family protein
VPREEVDHWIDLDTATCQHLFEVARIVGRAQDAAFHPRRVGMLIAGDEVPHAHIHLVPIDHVGQLSFANVDRNADASALDAAADAIREQLRAMGRREVGA